MTGVLNDDLALSDDDEDDDEMPSQVAADSDLDTDDGNATNVSKYLLLSVIIFRRSNSG